MCNISKSWFMLQSTANNLITQRNSVGMSHDEINDANLK